MVSIFLSIILMPSAANHGTPILLGELRAESYWESLDSSTLCPLPPSELITALANVNLFMPWLTLGLFPNPGQVVKGPGTGGQGKGGWLRTGGARGGLQAPSSLPYGPCPSCIWESSPPPHQSRGLGEVPPPASK